MTGELDPRAEVERLLSQIPDPDQREGIKEITARVTARICTGLDTSSPEIAKLFRQESKSDFNHSRRFREVMAKSADLLEQGMSLRAAVGLAVVDYEVKKYMAGVQISPPDPETGRRMILTRLSVIKIQTQNPDTGEWEWDEFLEEQTGGGFRNEFEMKKPAS
jgi:hypothetical protein